MTQILAKRALTAAVVLACATFGQIARPAPSRDQLVETTETLASASGWQPASVAEIKAEVFAWLDAQQPDESVQAQAVQLWQSVDEEWTGRRLLDRLAETFALVDANARELVDLCGRLAEDPVPPSFPWLADEKTPPLVANNLRLLYGRWLAHQRLFDESLQQLSGLDPGEVVDPASLLFYRAVAYHRLLDREAGLKAIGQLLAGEHQCPDRYVAVARLIEADLKQLEPETLDHIARRMEDIERRLALGRAGAKVREVEDGVIESLDKLIKELEAAAQQQSGAGGADSRQSSSPAQDSRIMGGKGPGHVTKRDIGSSAGWGNLPPKEREQAMQRISREFPSHYRDAIEQYFRKLAGQGSQGE